MKFNLRLPTRTLIVALAVSALLLTLASFFPAQIVALFLPGSQMDLPLGPTPLPPVIAAAPGPMPPPPGGVSQWKQMRGADYAAVGCGFLLRLGGGQIVGVTTAHSVGWLGAPDNPVERMAFALPQSGRILTEFDTLFGPPGVPRTGDDFTVDYVLLKVTGPVDDALVLTPDPRGAPQPGERVSIYSGLGPGADGNSAFPGTVVTVDERGAWVRMDGALDASGMSGSPFISQYTGRVVGMAIALARVGDLRLIAIHPIGHLVHLAEAATQFPQIADYRR